MAGEMEYARGLGLVLGFSLGIVQAERALKSPPTRN
jgi:hypothetical protein